MKTLYLTLLVLSLVCSTFCSSDEADNQDNGDFEVAQLGEDNFQDDEEFNRMLRGPTFSRILRGGPQSFSRILRSGPQSFSRILRGKPQSFSRILRGGPQSFSRILRGGPQSFSRILQGGGPQGFSRILRGGGPQTFSRILRSDKSDADVKRQSFSRILRSALARIHKRSTDKQSNIALDMRSYSQILRSDPHLSHILRSVDMDQNEDAMKEEELGYSSILGKL